jgi:hypothetical protein
VARRSPCPATSGTGRRARPQQFWGPYRHRSRWRRDPIPAAARRTIPGNGADPCWPRAGRRDRGQRKVAHSTALAVDSVISRSTTPSLPMAESVPPSSLILGGVPCGRKVAISVSSVRAVATSCADVLVERLRRTSPPRPCVPDSAFRSRWERSDDRLCACTTGSYDAGYARDGPCGGARVRGFQPSNHGRSGVWDLVVCKRRLSLRWFEPNTRHKNPLFCKGILDAIDGACEAKGAAQKTAGFRVIGQLVPALCWFALMSRPPVKSRAPANDLR